MRDWLNDVIGDSLAVVYEDLDATRDALLWLREKPRTFRELRTEDIDWLRWMAANTSDTNLLERLSEDADSDVRMWVACNSMTPKPVLIKLAEDSVVFVRRGVAQNSNTPPASLDKLGNDADFAVRSLVYRNRKRSPLSSTRLPHS
jgi:hypothetical protein